MGINEIIKVGDNLRKYRKKLNLTQSQMADNLKIPRSTYANYENNTREPSLEMLNKIAKTLGVATNLLIGKRKTATQEIIEELISKGITLEQTSKGTGITSDEINAAYNNTGDFSSDSIVKIGKYIGATNEQIAKWMLNNTITNVLYGDSMSCPKIAMDTAAFLQKNASDKDLFIKVNDKGNAIIEYMFNSDDIHTLKSKKEPLFSTKIGSTYTDTIKYFLMFLQHCDNCPIDKLDENSINYLYKKITDTIEFEFYKLKKNDYKVPLNEK